MATNLIGQALPAKVVRVSSTTLYHVAARELGDAQQWWRIGALNGLTDPVILGTIELKIPQASTENNGGVPQP